MDLSGLEDGSLTADKVSQNGKVWLGIVRERLVEETDGKKARAIGERNRFAVTISNLRHGGASPCVRNTE